MRQGGSEGGDRVSSCNQVSCCCDARWREGPARHKNLCECSAVLLASKVAHAQRVVVVVEEITYNVNVFIEVNLREQKSNK